MSFQTDPDAIRWRLHLTAPIASVYHTLSTDTGRASFWAQAARDHNGVIHFVFPNRMTWDATILEAVPPHRYCIRYVGHSVTTFDLTDDGHGGTDLTVIDSGVPARDRAEVIAGWVSVLMNLKAVVDFGVDLRVHDPARHWETGYVEN
jgi:uncharacterized protein YndB with AHSA1/START domain